MVKSINITTPGITRYPLHRHGFCEIMYYTEGTGFLETEYGSYSFSPGTAIIVPPNVLHGSVSENGFKNISVGGNFDSIITNGKPILISSAADSDTLARLVYKNRFNGTEYLNSLADCYILSLMQSQSPNSQIAVAVRKIANIISENADNPEFNIANELTLSSYAEDYIRAKFKEILNVTPTEFLNRLRIKNACRMMEIYGSSITVTEIAVNVGLNPAYFSRVFKKAMGVCPQEYKNRVLCSENRKAE